MDALARIAGRYDRARGAQAVGLTIESARAASLSCRGAGRVILVKSNRWTNYNFSTIGRDWRSSANRRISRARS